jgi:hypothetical protein
LSLISQPKTIVIVTATDRIGESDLVLGDFMILTAADSMVRTAKSEGACEVNERC